MEAAGFCSGAAGGGSQSSVELQEEAARYSGAAGGAAMIFQRIRFGAAACDSGSSSTGHCGGAVVTAAGGGSQSSVELQEEAARYSGAAGGAAMIFQRIRFGAAACDSGSSSTGHCGGAVVTAAGGAAESSVGLQVQSGYHWGAAGGSSDILADFDMCSCVWQWQQQHRILRSGAVVTAAGVAAEILSEAAGAVRISLGSCCVEQRDFQRFRIGVLQRSDDSSSTGYCGGSSGDSCRCAQQVTLSEAAGAVRIFTGELRSGDSSDITTNRFGAAAR